MTFCLNLCEIANAELICSIENGLIKLMDFVKEKKCTEVERLRIGSDFCANYFMSYPWRQYFESIDIPTTIVIPVFSERNLLSAKNIISDLISQYGEQFDEVTVNDFGMMKYLQDNYPTYKLNAGRLLSKCPRDKRLSTLYHIDKQWELYGQYDIISETANFDSIEFDLNYGNFLWNKAQRRNRVSVHYPYCYVTTGNICKFSSVHKALKKKFRANCNCMQECQHIYEFHPDGEFIQIGRTIYFNNEKCRIAENSYDNILYFPIQEILQVKGKK